MPYQMTNTVIGFYISVFLLDTAQISPAAASAVIFAGRIWDAITDPFVGFVVTKTDTRFGKLKPWMTMAAPCASITFFFIWWVPDTGSQSLLTVWYLLFYCAFQTFLSFYHMPFSTLTLYLSEKQPDRDSVTMFRMISEVFGAVLGNVIMGQVMMSYTRGYERPGCSNETFNETDPIFYEKEKQGYTVAAFILSIIILCNACCVLFGTTEKKIKKNNRKDEHNFFTGVKKVLTFRPYVMLMLAFLFIYLGAMVFQGSFALFHKYVMLEEDYTTFIIIVIASGFLLVPFWQFFLMRFGKKRALFLGTLLSFPMFIVDAFIPPGYLWVQYIVSALSGNVVAVAMLVPWSMLPDVIDDFLIKTGNTYEAVFYSFFVMFMKFATGISLAVSTLALGASGYVTAGCEQPESVQLTLRLLVSIVPLGCVLIGMAFTLLYPITEEIRRKNKTTLEIWRSRRHSGEEEAELLLDTDEGVVPDMNENSGPTLDERAI